MSMIVIVFLKKKNKVNIFKFTMLVSISNFVHCNGGTVHFFPSQIKEISFT